MDTPGFEWFRFYNGGDGPDVHSKQVCRLPRDVAQLIGAKSEIVRIGLEYVRKAVNKHNLSFDHFPMMAQAIRFGDVYLSDKGVNFFYRDNVVFSPLFFVGLKSSKQGQEIWVRTFHRKSAAKHNSLIRRMKLIRLQGN